MFGWTQDRLTRSGYDHYEISNYALTGMQSRHNLACWRGRSYLGVGASAHSFDGTRRSWNVRDLKTYLDQRPDDAGTWVLLGDVYWSAGKPSEARSRWFHAQRLAQTQTGAEEILEVINARLSQPETDP